MRGKCRLAFAALFLIYLAAPAFAAVTEYTDLKSFNTAVSGTATYDFNNIAPPGEIAFFATPILGGVTFSGVDGQMYGVVDVGVSNGDGYGTSFFTGQTTNSSDPSYVIATTTGVRAIGFTYGTYIGSLVPFTVTLSSGDVFTLTTPYVSDNYSGVTGFVGFVSDAPITSVMFVEQGGSMDITQLTVGPATAPVPVPAALLLFGPGLVGIAAMRKKVKKNDVGRVRN
jgi:hypothetical protein